MTKFLLIFIAVLFSDSVVAENADACQLSSPYKIQISGVKVMFQGEGLPTTLFEHNTIAVNGGALKLNVSQQYQAASFGESSSKSIVISPVCLRKNRGTGNSFNGTDFSKHYFS